MIQLGLFAPPPLDLPTRVVNLRREPWDVYIGRPGQGLDGPFGNPIRRGVPCLMCADGTIHVHGGDTLGCYEAWLRARLGRDAAFRAAVEGLRGRRLGCFCRPDSGFGGRLLCHGQVIVGWLHGVEPRLVA